jgi:hypothetical protein
MTIVQPEAHGPKILTTSGAIATVRQYATNSERLPPLLCSTMTVGGVMVG